MVIRSKKKTQKNKEGSGDLLIRPRKKIAIIRTEIKDKSNKF